MLLALFGTAWLWLALDRNLARTSLEKAITALSGHPFTIEGEFDYQLGGTIRVDAGKIRWRTSAFDDSRPLLQIERLSGALQLWRLIEWPIRVADLQIDQGQVWLEWDDAGGFNWAGGSRTRPDRQPRALLPLVIERGSLRNLVIRLRHPALTDQLEILVTEAQQQRDVANRLVMAGASTRGWPSRACRVRPMLTSKPIPRKRV